MPAERQPGAWLYVCKQADTADRMCYHVHVLAGLDENTVVYQFRLHAQVTI